METFGDQLLAGAALADDEHWPVERRSAARPLDRVEEGQALADELFRPLHNWPTVGGKSHHLARIFTAFSLAKLRISRKFGVSEKMARLLYGLGQV